MKSSPKRKFFFFTLSLCIFPFLSISAQFRCGDDEFHQKRFLTGALYRADFLKFRKTFSVAGHANRTVNGEAVLPMIDTFTVVFHILHTGEPLGTTNNPTDDSIRSWLNALNEIYAGSVTGTGGAGDLGIRFALAKTDPYCGPTTGINHIDATSLVNYLKYGVEAVSESPGSTIADLRRFILWDPDRYLNIWLVNRLDAGKYFGVSPFPIDTANFGPIMEASGTGNPYLIAHEVGHSFFLNHVFAGSSYDDCTINTDCTVDGDAVCDTDPVTEPSDGSCRSGVNPCTQTAYLSNTESNYMNYSSCGSNLFTAGQRDRMQWAIRNIPILDTLSKSTARFPPGDKGNCSIGIQLSGEKLGTGGIALTWTGGVSNAPFIVQKSPDVFRYQNLAQVGPTHLAQYSLTDYSVLQMQNYYRVRQQTSTGKWIYSNDLFFSDSVTIYQQLILRRNPVADYIDVQLATMPQIRSPLSGSFGMVAATIRIIDMAGRVMYRSTIQVYSFQRFRVPAESLAPGEYILEVTINRVRYVMPVLKG